MRLFNIINMRLFIIIIKLLNLIMRLFIINIFRDID